MVRPLLYTSSAAQEGSVRANAKKSGSTLDIAFCAAYDFAMATLNDVAKASGVSTASVSRFINDPSSVGEKIALRIRAAIEKLDYRIDSSARSLKTGKFGRISIISPATGPFYWEIISAIAYSLSPSGYFIDITFTREPKYRRNDRFGLYTKRNVDGTVIFPLRTEEDDEFIRHIGDARENFVIIDRDIDREGLYRIVIDNHDIGSTAARLFLENGHTRFIFIKGNDDLDSTHERLRGFSEELGKAGITLGQNRIIEGKYNPEITYGIVKERIGSFPDFTAVFASNDLTALAFARAAFEERRLIIPEDYSIVSVDDSDYIPYCMPQISSFRLPLQTIGSLAGSMLLAQIEGSVIKERRVVLKSDLVRRNSITSINR